MSAVSDDEENGLERDEEDFKSPVQTGFSFQMNFETRHGSLESQSSPSATKLEIRSLSQNIAIKPHHEPTDKHNRTIIHIDIDCFYAQVEMILNPSLRGKPLGIQQKYLLVTCNYTARERGVTKLMSVVDAKSKCPDIIIIKGEDLTKYREMSERIFSLLKQHCPVVQRLGMDETFLDVTEQVNQRMSDDSKQVEGYLYAHQNNEKSLLEKPDHCTCGCHKRLVIGSQIAAELRRALKDHLGITSCAGISYNKLLSKLVAGAHKPNQQTTLFPEDSSKLLSELKPGHIPGIGHNTVKRLQGIGVNTMQELLSCPTAVLSTEFGPTAASKIKNLACGIDDSEVVLSGLPKSVSDEDSFQKCSNLDDATSAMKSLILNLLPRLKEDLHAPQTVRLTIRRYNAQAANYSTRNKRESRQTNLPSKFLTCNEPENKLEIVLKTVLELFHKMVNVKQPFHLTLINVCFINFRKTPNSITNIFFRGSTSHKRKLKTEDIVVNSDIRPDQCSSYQCLEGASRKAMRIDMDSSKNWDNSEEDGRNEVHCKSLMSDSATASDPASLWEDIVPGYKVDSTDLFEQSDRFQNDGGTNSNHCFKGANKVVEACNRVIPPGIDASIFCELPADIQKELLVQWKETEQSKVNKTNKDKKEKQVHGILKYFSKN